MSLPLCSIIIYATASLGTLTGLRYCDEEINNICFHSDYYDSQQRVNNLPDAQRICAKNDSILLEIHNKSYQNAVDRAFKAWGMLEWYFLLNIGFQSGDLIWLTSKTKVNFTNWNPGQLGTSPTYGAFIVPNGKSNFWFPATTPLQDFYGFVCLHVNTSGSSPNFRITAKPINPAPNIRPISTHFPPVNSTTVAGLNESSGSKKETVKKDTHSLSTGVGVGLIVCLLTIVLAGFALRGFSKREKSNAEKSSKHEITVKPIKRKSHKTPIQIIFEEVQLDNDDCGPSTSSSSYLVTNV